MLIVPTMVAFYPTCKLQLFNQRIRCYFVICVSDIGTSYVHFVERALLPIIVFIKTVNPLAIDRHVALFVFVSHLHMFFTYHRVFESALYAYQLEIGFGLLHHNF